MANSTIVDYGETLERARLAHFLDANFSEGATDYVRLGKDLEDYSVELNPDTEQKKNIIGENIFLLKGYSPTSDVETHYARESDPIFTKLRAFAEERIKDLEKLKTTYLSIWLNKDGTVDKAYREEVYVVPKSIGGDTGAISIPYTIYHTGAIEQGTFNTTTRTFTAAQVVS